MKRALSTFMFVLLLVSTLTFAVNTQNVEANGTIYLRADGSIDPPTAPIQRDGDVYTLTGNITSSGDGIAIERDNMTVEGAAYTIQGSGAYPYCRGINVTGRMNVTIRNVGIRDFYYGVYLSGSSNNNVSVSIMKSNAFGILLADSSEHNSISGNNLTNNGYGGIKLYSSSSNILVGNNIKAYKNLDAGITLGYSSNNSIVGNSMISDQYGMWLYYSSNSSIHHNNFMDNTIQQVAIGTSVYGNFWDDGYPSGGNYWSDYAGVDLYNSVYQNVTGSDGIGDSAHVIDASNADNYPLMKPYPGPVQNLNTGQSYRTIQGAINNASEGDAILALSGTYYEHVVANKTVSLIGENKSNTIVDGNGTGNVITIAANNVNFTGFTLQNSGSSPNAGIYLDSSSGNNIGHNIIIANNEGIGICLFSSSNYNIISGNNITNNKGGIHLFSSSNYNIISGNNITNNYCGITLWSSSNNTASGNNVTNNDCGIWLDEPSNYNTFSGNKITDNNKGIDIWASSNNVFRNNIMANNRYNFGVTGDALSHFIQDVDFSNTVDGKPMYYWVNKQDLTVPLDAGYVALVDCTGITVQNLTLTNNGQGILLAYTTNSQIKNNNITNNWYGIGLSRSSNSSIFGNNVTNNYCGILLDWSSNNNVSGNKIATNNKGIYLYHSSNNNISGNNVTNNVNGIWLDESSNSEFYHNNFIDNTQQVYIETLGYADSWDDGYPSGGNYWSDYTDVDLCNGPDQDILGSDGILDHPYIIDANNRDRYPFVSWTLPDITPPEMNILSPQNITYTTASVPLTFTVNETTSWTGYCLDNQANMTITGNTTLTGLSEGTHNVMVYGNDSSGNMGVSGTVYFTIIPPLIHDVAITELYSSKNVVGQGLALHLNLTVENHGDCNETVDVAIYANATLVTSQNVNLQKDASTSILFMWNTTSFAEGCRCYEKGRTVCGLWHAHTGIVVQR